MLIGKIPSFNVRAPFRRALATVGSFYDIPHPDVFVHLRNATQELSSSVPQQDILLTNVVSISLSLIVKGSGQHFG